MDFQLRVSLHPLCAEELVMFSGEFAHSPVGASGLGIWGFCFPVQTVLRESGTQ